VNILYVPLFRVEIVVVWKHRAFSWRCAELVLLSVSPLLVGCHLQHSSPAANRAKLQVGSAGASSVGLPVQQSPQYQAAVRQFGRHDYPAALTGINHLLQQPQYRQRTADNAFLLRQRAICRHAIDPSVTASFSSLTASAVPHPTPRLASQADCGPRALLLLCPQLGVRTTLDAIRRQAGTTGKGTSMKGLAQAAKSLGLKAQGINVDKQALRQLPNPAIAWYDGNHYVALISVEGEQATIHDPNKPNEEVLPINELLGRSGGFLLTLSR